MDSELIKESIGKLYVKYLIPSLGGALAPSVSSFVDKIAVGQACGPDGAAAIAVINPYFALMCFIGLLFGIGGSVLMSHRKGEGNIREADRVFSLTILLLAIFTLFSWILSALFIDEILFFSGADEELLPYAKAYIMPIVVAFPLFAINTFLPPIVRYDEKPKLVLKAVLIGGCFNIFGDWFLVFPMGMGMFGAGLATAIGALIQTIILLTAFRKGQTSLHLVKPKETVRTSMKILSTGFGGGILDVAIAVLTIMINKQTMKYGGRDELAVLGVIMTIAFLLQHFFAGIGQAVQPIASTNFGAGLRKRTWESFTYLWWTSILFSVISAVVCILFPSQILSVFMDTTENVLSIGPHIVRIYSLSFLLMALNINIVFFLQSVLLPFPAMIFSLMRGLIASGLLLVILPLIIGMDGILWAMTGAEIITAMLAIPYTLASRRRQLAQTVHNPLDIVPES